MVHNPKVVIVGGGFAGINCAHGLAQQPVDVILVDRKNHHTFQPLLYQVATGTLSPADIAQPIRSMFAHCENITVLLDEVVDFDLSKKEVRLLYETPLNYDYLVVAAGSTHSYFGHDEKWSKYAPGLKSIEDATEIRRQIFMAFEKAEREGREQGKQPPLNFVVIGGGPTGLELAGAIADTCRLYLQNNYRHIDPSRSRIIIIEALPNVLPMYPQPLINDALKQLKDMGVEVMSSTRVMDIDDGVVTTDQGKIEASVVLWAAGVKASPLGQKLGVDCDRKGCALVDDNLHPKLAGKLLKDVFICGDLAHFEQDGHQVPGVAQPAIQMGGYAAKAIGFDMKRVEPPPFRYFDKGDLATIGRFRAVANVKWPFHSQMAGAPAWVVWAVIHIFFLIGLRNRAAVFTQWVWSFLTRRRCVQLITGNENKAVERSSEQSAG